MFRHRKLTILFDSIAKLFFSCHLFFPSLRGTGASFKRNHQHHWQLGGLCFGSHGKRSVRQNKNGNLISHQFLILSCLFASHQMRQEFLQGCHSSLKLKQKFCWHFAIKLSVLVLSGHNPIIDDFLFFDTKFSFLKNKNTLFINFWEIKDWYAPLINSVSNLF